MRRHLPFAVFLVFFVAHPGWSQFQPASARMSFTVGAGYDQGDFGTSDLSRALYFPFSFRYTASQFDLSVSSSVARLSASDGVRLIDGVPTPTGGVRSFRETGLGDTVFRSRLFLVNDRGPGTSTPSITPFFRLKLPTAPEQRGLGTGRVDYGFGVELEKDLGPAFIFGDLGYTVVGKIPGIGLQNRTLASAGAGKQLSDTVSVSSMLDWRKSIVAGSPDAAELVGVLSYRVNSTTISPNAYVGLTAGSSDFGLGIQLRFRFGGK